MEQARAPSVSVATHGFAIAPDGARVAVLSLRDGQPCLAVFDVATAACVDEFSLPTGRPGGLAWSPDGAALAFYAPTLAAPPFCDIYVLHLASREVRSVTPGLRRHAHVPAWSPDAGSVAFAAREPSVRSHQPPHLFEVALASGALRQLTQSDAADFTPQWSPDQRLLAFRRERDVWLLDRDRNEARRLTHTGGHIGIACFSPNGDRLVFDYRASHEKRTVAVVDIATGGVRALTPPETDARSPSWSQSSGAISYIQRTEHGPRMVVVGHDGTPRWTAAPAPLGERRIVDGFNRPIWATRAEVLALLDGDGNVWIARAGTAPRRVTALAPKPPPAHPPEEISYESHGGARVPARLFRPPGFGPGRGSGHSGAVIWVHGGPSAPLEDPRNPYVQALVEAGLLVLAPGYRGTTGQGEEWARLSPDDAGVVDLGDVVAAHDFLLADGLVARGRVGVAGYSYGGFLTLLALAKQPDSWAAGASLWGAFRPDGVNPIRHVALRRGAAWLAERSPLAQIDRIAAPLLILHGAQDSYAAVEDVQAAHAALTQRGRICELEIFWDDTHGLNRHIPECVGRLTEFFARHLGR